MTTEKFTNRATTTLNGAINNSTTSVVVTDASSFPSSGNFRILIDSEVMLVTAVSSNTFTVTRGVESTGAASHSNLVTVAHVLTAGALDQYRSDNIQTGASSSLPAAEKDGRLYFSNDGPYVYRDNGSAWAAFGPVSPMAPMVLGNFSWVNQHQATAVQQGGSVYFSSPGTPDNGLELFVKNIPIAPYRVTFGFIPILSLGTATCAPGICFYNSSNGKILSFALRQDSFNTVPVPTHAVDEWTNTTTYAGVSPYFSQTAALYYGTVIYWQLQDDTTNWKFNVSNDGVNYITLFSTAHNTFLTPDKIGFCYRNMGNPSGMNVLHYKET